MALCERCKRAQATFHLTDIEPSGAKVEKHLCEECAVKEGLIQPKPSININEYIESLIVSSKGAQPQVSNAVCEECGISYTEFRNQGMLGCPHDYDVFKDQLVRLLDRAHFGATKHTGKAPRSMGARAALAGPDLRKLRRQLEEAISAEDYERAAELRDRIRELGVV
jgi:protein arginine kinase activator